MLCKVTKKFVVPYMNGKNVQLIDYTLHLKFVLQRWVKIDPIEVQIHPEYDDKYRILDGAHRWHAYKEIGATEISVHIITLDGLDPLLYAAKKAIGPLQLNEEEARNTARRAYQDNPLLTSYEIGQAIGRSRRTVDDYIADLKATFQLDLDLKIFRMNRMVIPQVWNFGVKS